MSAANESMYGFLSPERARLLAKHRVELDQWWEQVTEAYERDLDAYVRNALVHALHTLHGQKPWEELSPVEVEQWESEAGFLLTQLKDDGVRFRVENRPETENEAESKTE